MIESPSYEFPNYPEEFKEPYVRSNRIEENPGRKFIPEKIPMEKEVLLHRSTRQVACRIKERYDKVCGVLRVKEERWEAAIKDYAKLFEDLESATEPTCRQELKASIKLIRAELVKIYNSAEEARYEYQSSTSRDVRTLYKEIFPQSNKLDLVTPPSTPIPSETENIITIEEIRDLLSALDKQIKVLYYQAQMIKRRQIQAAMVLASQSKTDKEQTGTSKRQAARARPRFTRRRMATPMDNPQKTVKRDNGQVTACASPEMFDKPSDPHKIQSCLRGLEPSHPESSRRVQFSAKPEDPLREKRELLAS